MTNNKKNHISTHNYFIDKYLSLCNVLNMYPYIWFEILQQDI